MTWQISAGAGSWYCLYKARNYTDRNISRIGIARIIASCAYGLFIILKIEPAFAQEAPWQQYEKTISKKQDVASLSNELFGESIDLYNGRISFRHVDIELTGNNSLPVTLARTFSVVDGIEYSTQNSFVDWDLDVPRISGIYVSRYDTWMTTTYYTWSDQRCSGNLTPPTVGPFFPADYWYGLQASMTGGGELLTPNSNARKPTDGGNYRWITTDFTWFSCLTNIKNGTGEGFLAIAKDGTKYWFDWLAVYDVWPVLESYDLGYAEQIQRKKNVLYATRVQDRYGNWVNYIYSNASTAPVKLDRIESSDGRHIDLTYDTAGKIISATDGSRTFSYAYTSGTRSLLSTVTLPDGSQWKLNSSDLYNLNVTLANEPKCDSPGTWNADIPPVRSMVITHPSGAIGEFFVDARLHGRSNVRRNCLGTADSPYSDFVRMYWVPSIIKKIISGPGVQSLEWNYNYINADVLGANNNSSSHSPPGTWAAASTAAYGEPVCLSESCAGSTTTLVTTNFGDWRRYTYGNSYRYNEHKLLKLERGTDANTVIRTEQYGYELAQSGQSFPTPVGVSSQYKGDSYTDTYLRPLRSTVITQNGILYKTNVETFDEYGRPLSIVKSSQP